MRLEDGTLAPSNVQGQKGLINDPRHTAETSRKTRTTGRSIPVDHVGSYKSGQFSSRLSRKESKPALPDKTGPSMVVAIPQ